MLWEDKYRNVSELVKFRYIVTCDPVGAKIGNGGATMHVLEQLRDEVDSEELLKGESVHLWV